MRPFLLRTIVGMTWIGAVAVLFGHFIAYDLQQAETNVTSAIWPNDTALDFDGDADRVLMFVHARCPCTRASAAELAEVVSRCETKPRVTFVLVDPGTDAASSVPSTIAGVVESLGATVAVDLGGVECRRFGASASGHVLIYDAARKLRYSGGVTAMRGHYGDNPQRQAALQALGPSDGGHSPGVCGPVFGCPLIDSN